MTTPAPEPTTRLRLADGRSLDLWIDERDSAADLTPLVFHSGTPGSGYGYHVFAAQARERGLRMVGWSRPGYGSSTRLPGRRVSHIAADTAAVLDHIGAEQAFVAGHSGGGPHALACAALLPDRVLATALIASVAPFEAAGLDFLEGMGQENHAEFGAAVAGEAALSAYLDAPRREILGLSGPDVAAMFGDLVDDVDRGAITGGYAAWLADNMREGLRESSAGWLDDDLSFIRPWGFELGSVSSRVHVWQGGHDRMVPFAHGRWLAAALANPCTHLHPEHGHLSLAVSGIPQIFESLTAGT